MKNLICITLLCLISFGCIGQSYIRKGKIKKRKFTNTQYQLPAESLLHLKGVYIGESYIPETGDTHYDFYRFFQNGRVFTSEVYNHYPTDQELSDLKYGTCTYYSIADNKLEIEMYNGYKGYFFDVGIIEDGKIKITGNKNCRICPVQNYPAFEYTFKEIELSSQPDW